LTAPATLSDGGQAVPKLNFPEEESAYEGRCLTHWRGEGAVRLLEVDRERNALLIERAGPGTSLWEVEDDEEATVIAASVMARLWLLPPPDSNPFRRLPMRQSAGRRSFAPTGRRSAGRSSKGWSTQQPRPPVSSPGRRRSWRSATRISRAATS
jgi:hypothetical protein